MLNFQIGIASSNKRSDRSLNQHMYNHSFIVCISYDIRANKKWEWTQLTRRHIAPHRLSCWHLVDAGRAAKYGRIEHHRAGVERLLLLLLLHLLLMLGRGRRGRRRVRVGGGVESQLADESLLLGAQLLHETESGGRCGRVGRGGRHRRRQRLLLQLKLLHLMQDGAHVSDAVRAYVRARVRLLVSICNTTS